MIFLCLLISNIFLNFGLTAYNLFLMVKNDDYTLYYDYINFIPLAIRDNKYIIMATSGVVLLITFFFILRAVSICIC